jgi:hypothetical protein
VSSEFPGAAIGTALPGLPGELERSALSGSASCGMQPALDSHAGMAEVAGPTCGPLGIGGQKDLAGSMPLSLFV